ncbi:hypothetical protein HA402_015142 [Bradysia odoriphaga]|nr:hypothetical protein HA402_015142 [Bradysia odoriphaga]
MNYAIFGILLVLACISASSFALEESYSNRTCKLDDELKSVIGNLLNVTENVEHDAAESDLCEIFKTLLKATKGVLPHITTEFAISDILQGLISKTDTIPQASVCQLLRIIPGLKDLIITTIKSNAFAEIRITITKALDDKTDETEKEKLNCQLVDQVAQLFGGFDLNFFRNFLVGVTHFVNKLLGGVFGTLGELVP